MTRIFDDLEDGFKQAIVAGVIGFFLSIVLTVAGFIYPTLGLYGSLIELILFVSSILLITKLEYWSSGYLVGFLVAEWILSVFRLENSSLVMIYTIVGGLIILERFTKFISKIISNIISNL